MKRAKPRIAVADVTLDLVRALLTYDPLTGSFTWRVNRGGTARAGTKAGSIDAYGYILVRIGNRNFKAHRLAWLYVTGEWPTGDIDHINGQRADNRFTNLRDVAHSQNLINCGRHAHNTSGSGGVAWRADKKKWVAALQLKGKYVHLGYFATRSEAEAARKTAAEQYVGGPVRSTTMET